MTENVLRGGMRLIAPQGTYATPESPRSIRGTIVFPQLTEADGSWQVAQTLLRDRGGELRAAVKEIATDRAVPDGIVPASWFAMSYSQQLVGAALACLVVGSGPDLSPGNVFVRQNGSKFQMALKDTRSAACTHGEPESDVDPTKFHRQRFRRWVAETVVDGHLGLMVDALHRSLRAPRRLLWGDVAARAAGAAKVLVESNWDQQEVAAALGDLIERWGTPTHRLVRWAIADGQMTRQRTNCCLRYKHPGFDMCKDCSLRRSASEQSQVIVEKGR